MKRFDGSRWWWQASLAAAAGVLAICYAAQLDAHLDLNPHRVSGRLEMVEHTSMRPDENGGPVDIMSYRELCVRAVPDGRLLARFSAFLPQPDGWLHIRLQNRDPDQIEPESSLTYSGYIRTWRTAEANYTVRYAGVGRRVVTDIGPDPQARP